MDPEGTCEGLVWVPDSALTELWIGLHAVGPRLTHTRATQVYQLSEAHEGRCIQGCPRALEWQKGEKRVGVWGLWV